MNFSWITDHLAVGGAFSAGDLDAVTEHRIVAIVDVRAEACDNERALRTRGIGFLHLPTDDHCAISVPHLEAGIAFVVRHLQRGERVLVHCHHGIGRSALLALCALVALCHEPLAALELAKQRRGVVSPSPAQYEAWAAWMRARGIEAPHFDDFAAIAYRHLGGR